MLRKENHLGEASVKKGERKALTKNRDSIEGPHEEAEIERKPRDEEKTWPPVNISV